MPSNGTSNVILAESNSSGQMVSQLLHEGLYSKGLTLMLNFCREINAFRVWVWVPQLPVTLMRDSIWSKRLNGRKECAEVMTKTVRSTVRVTEKELAAMLVGLYVPMLKPHINAWLKSQLESDEDCEKEESNDDCDDYQQVFWNHQYIRKMLYL